MQSPSVGPGQSLETHPGALRTSSVGTEAHGPPFQRRSAAPPLAPQPTSQTHQFQAPLGGYSQQPLFAIQRGPCKGRSPSSFSATALPTFSMIVVSSKYQAGESPKEGNAASFRIFRLCPGPNLRQRQLSVCALHHCNCAVPSHWQNSQAHQCFSSSPWFSTKYCAHAGLRQPVQGRRRHRPTIAPRSPPVRSVRSPQVNYHLSGRPHSWSPSVDQTGLLLWGHSSSSHMT